MLSVGLAPLVASSEQGEALLLEVTLVGSESAGDTVSSSFLSSLLLFSPSYVPGRRFRVIMRIGTVFAHKNRILATFLSNYE